MIKINEAKPGDFNRIAKEHFDILEKNMINNIQSLQIKCAKAKTHSSWQKEIVFYDFIEKQLNPLIVGKHQQLESFIGHIEKYYLISEEKINSIVSEAKNVVLKAIFPGDKTKSTQDKLRYLRSVIRNKLPLSINHSTHLNGKLVQDIIDLLDNINIHNKYLLKDWKRDIGAIPHVHTPFGERIKENLLSVFNYKGFRASEHAYKLLEALNVKVCPYCNRQFISIYNSDDGKTGPELDHFLPKSKYPYLALSFYNLIPCCHVCNSNLKGSLDTYGSHLNPYVEGFGNDIKFTIRFAQTEKEIDDIYKGLTSDDLKNGNYTGTYVDFLLGKSDNFEIGFVGLSTLNKYKKAMNNIRDFKLVGLYKNHRDYIQELIKKAIVYNKTRIDELYSQYGGTLFSSREEVVSTIIGNYIDEKDLDKRVLAKFILDISEELGLKKL